MLGRAVRPSLAAVRSLVRLLALVTCSALALGLAACGGGGTGDGGTQQSGEQSSGDGSQVKVTRITKKQWLAVPLGATKEEVVAEFGEPGEEGQAGEIDHIQYTLTPNADVYVGFAFDIETGRLEDKTWTVEPGGDNPIGAALYRRVANGMTEAQVLQVLGVPWSRDDAVSSYTVAERGAVRPGTLQRCFIYTGITATICFDQAGKVHYMYPPND